MKSMTKFAFSVAAACSSTVMAIPNLAHAQGFADLPDDERKTIIATALLLIGAYFAPSIIAMSRKHPSKGAIIVLNVVLGLTAIGWIVALIWSLSATKQTVVFASPTPLPTAAPADQSSRASDSGSTKTVGERISDLKSMMDSGAITEAEFNLLKADAMKGVS